MPVLVTAIFCFGMLSDASILYQLFGWILGNPAERGD